MCLFGGTWRGLPGFSLCHSTAGEGLGEDSAHPRGSQQDGTWVTCISTYTHLVQEEKRIKLFAFKNFSTEFYIQNNKVSKEKEAILT